MKRFSLYLSLACIVIWIASCLFDSVHSLLMLCGLSSSGHGLLQRIYFSFIHFGFLHLFVNIYSFLTLALLCRMRIWQFIASLIVAASIPAPLLVDLPVVGLSAIIYAATGIIISSSCRFWSLLVINMLIISAGFFFPFVAAPIHLWCFALGLMFGFFTAKVHVRRH